MDANSDNEAKSVLYLLRGSKLLPSQGDVCDKIETCPRLIMLLFFIIFCVPLHEVVNEAIQARRQKLYTPA